MGATTSHFAYLKSPRTDLIKTTLFQKDKSPFNKVFITTSKILFLTFFNSVHFNMAP